MVVKVSGFVRTLSRKMMRTLYMSLENSADSRKIRTLSKVKTVGMVGTTTYRERGGTVFTLESVRAHDHFFAARTLSPTLHMGTDTF